MRSDDYMSQKKARSYREGRFYGKGGALVEDHEKRYLLQSIEDFTSKRDSYLDFAGGTGRVAKYVVDNCNLKSITLADSSKYMIEQAKDFIQSSKATFLLVQQKKKPAPIKKKYDIITTFHFIKHIPNPGDYFTIFSDAQKKDGLLVFDFLNKNSLVAFNKETCFLYSKSEIQKMLNDAGYELRNSKHVELLGESIYIKVPIPYILKLVLNSIDQLLSNTLLRPFATKVLISAVKKG